MNADGFAPFFEALHGHPPFPWQRRLAESVLATVLALVGPMAGACVGSRMLFGTRP